jgi:hypothetical protein
MNLSPLEIWLYGGNYPGEALTFSSGGQLPTLTGVPVSDPKKGKGRTIGR